MKWWWPVVLGCAGCAAVPKATISAEDWLAPLREPAAAPSKTLKSRAGTLASAKGDIRDVYRKVAPATVIVRSPHGFGTGVLIDARGYVLTNHHVISDAESIDFKRRVQVELGVMTAQGYMEKSPESLTAWVLKSDPLTDLAVLKIENPPPGLFVVQVSKTDPVPGEPVASLGHGGIGLLWAIRDGEVSSIGKLATHMAELVGAECQVTADPAVAAACAASRKQLEAERAQLATEVPGLVIQSSCQISPGDSGGPLVNRAGELVGLNAFLRSDPNVAVTTNFHVHVSEVRRFLEAVPAEPVALVPDPRLLARGAAAEPLDADQDGVEETTAYEAPHHTVVFVKLSAGELAVANEAGRTLVWWHDRLVVEGRPGSGRGTQWKPGSPPTKEATDALLFDRAALSAADQARFAAVETAVLEPFGLAVNEPLDVVPNPYAAAKWHLYDADQDRRFDSAWSGTSVLVDPKQTLAAPVTKAPLAFVRRGARGWCVLEIGTVLASEDAASGAITQGPRRGELMAAVALEGLGEPERKRARAALRKLLPKLNVEGAPWPSPLLEAGGDLIAEDSGVKGFGHAVVSVVGTGTSALLFELDRDAVSSSASEMERRAKRGQGADMAWVRRSETEWFLYDTDHDGAFDVMLFQAPSGPLEAFRMTAGKPVRAPELDAGLPVRAGLFSGQQAEAFTALAKVFFNAEVIAP